MPRSRQRTVLGPDVIFMVAWAEIPGFLGDEDPRMTLMWMWGVWRAPFDGPFDRLKKIPRKAVIGVDQASGCRGRNFFLV